MTLTVNVSPEAELRLLERAALSGVPLAEFVSQIVEEAAHNDEPRPNMIDHLRAIGVVGAVRGKQRPDGRSWSEVEAACDTH